ncbi:MAG: thermostable hemolysin [bacterium]|nr:thermostable hemolysin [bacterium]
MEKRADKIASFRMMADHKIDLELVTKEHSSRGEVEEFARDRYRRAYGAEMKTFARELLVLRSGTQGLLACVGLNTGDSGKLYLEQYLDAPLEEKIGSIVGKKIDRSKVAEIGTLATGARGLSRLTMISLTGVIISRGIDYIAFTGIKSVRNTLEQLGMPLESLATAAPEKLQGGADEWGSYYSAAPEVVFLDVKKGYKMVERLGREMNNMPAALGEMMKGLINRSYELEMAA